jgi:hypothetical protein
VIIWGVLIDTPLSLSFFNRKDTMSLVIKEYRIIWEAPCDCGACDGSRTVCDTRNTLPEAKEYITMLIRDDVIAPFSEEPFIEVVYVSTANPYDIVKYERLG